MERGVTDAVGEVRAEVGEAGEGLEDAVDEAIVGGVGEANDAAPAGGGGGGGVEEPGGAEEDVNEGCSGKGGAGAIGEGAVLGGGHGGGCGDGEAGRDVVGLRREVGARWRYSYRASCNLEGSVTGRQSAVDLCLQLQLGGWGS